MKKKENLPASIRCLVYSYLHFKDKFKLINLCKKEYKFLAEWRLYHQEDQE
jgi:hypothetical protein